MFLLDVISTSQIPHVFHFAQTTMIQVATITSLGCRLSFSGKRERRS